MGFRHSIKNTRRECRRCWYCGENTLDTKPTRDHQQPRSRGGTNTADNIVLACAACNNDKGSMDVETYRYFLRDRVPLGERMIFFGEMHPELCSLEVFPNRLTYTMSDVVPVDCFFTKKP